MSHTDKLEKRVQVLLTGEEANCLDRYCRDHGGKKSTLLAHLLRRFLAREGYLQLSGEIRQDQGCVGLGESMSQETDHRLSARTMRSSSDAIDFPGSPSDSCVPS